MPLVAMVLTACASGTPEPVSTREIILITATPSPAVSVTPTDEPLPFRDLSTPTLPPSGVGATPIPPSPTPAPASPTAMPAVVPTSAPISNPQSLISIQPTSIPPAQLPAQTADPVQPASDVASAEQAVIDLSNAQRAANGLPPLNRDEAITNIARSRSADMVLRDYFGHADPMTGALMAKPLVLALGYWRAGENIYWSGAGLAEFPAQAVNWFMADEPHRANILNSGYTAIGVGIVWNGLGWTLTQDFGGP